MTGIVAMVIAVLIRVVSGGDAQAVGDGGRAIGVLQQWKISVDEANRIIGEKRWTYADRKDPVKSVEMCRITLERHYRRGVTNPVDLACRWRNPSGQNCPRWYRERVKRAMKGTKGTKGTK